MRSEPLSSSLSRWSLQPRSPACRWAFAIIATAIAIGLRFALDGVLPPGFPFLTFFPAVILTAFFAGTAAGTASAAVGGLVAWRWFIHPFQGFGLANNTVVALLFYAVICGTVIGLIHLFKLALADLQGERQRGAALAEQRRLMFHELQHRVSNNLATISGLLTIQRRAVEDPAARKALEDAALRVGLVSRIQRLLHDPGAQALDLGGLLRQLSADLVESAGLTGQVEVVIDAEPLELGPDQAVPFGLIAAEIVSNSLEHGLRDGRGRIDIGLSLQGGLMTLVVRDQGKGVPARFSLATTTSLGLSIARQFAIQLGGTLSMSRPGSGGAETWLAFPPDAPGDGRGSAQQP